MKLSIEKQIIGAVTLFILSLVLLYAGVAFNLGKVKTDVVASELTLETIVKSESKNINDNVVVVASELQKLQQKIVSLELELSKKEVLNNQTKYEELLKLADGDKIVIGSDVFKIKSVVFEITAVNDATLGLSFGSALSNKHIPIGSKCIFTTELDKENFTSLNTIFTTTAQSASVVKQETGDNIIPLTIYTPDSDLARKWGRRLVEGVLLVKIK